MKLKEIHRTSTFAWSPYPGLPLVASGTVSGALDASFSNDSQLEIWDPNLLDKHSYDIGAEGLQGPQGVLTTSSRFNRLVWGNVTATRPKGVIAAGMENGELSLWDAEKIIENAEASAALIARNTNHTGPVRALDFNSFQTHLLSSGAVNGEIYIWDLNDPSKPYSPGARSAKLEDVTSVAWNSQVAHILASSSNSGFTAVWDLRGKREVVALAYGGGAATAGAGGPAGGAFATGGRRGMSDVAWHPDNATRLVTSSEDDSSPIIMSWDLRNARAPEKILTGHDKGVLSLSWCRQDADLLLSCGKDNRTLCWNPQTAELIGDLQAANNWAFQVQWCPRNPNLLATASFDGRIGIHSLQSTNEAEIASDNRTPQPEGADIFDQGNFGLQAQQQPTLSLKQPPKWLRRPVSATFGFGGQLISVSNQPSAQGAPQQTGSVHIRKFATEPSIVERAEKLKEAAEGEKLNEFAEQKSQDTQGETALEGWKALTSLFRANSRDELVTLLGFSKESIAANVQEAIKKVKASAAAGSQIATPSAPSTNVIPPEPQEEDVTESKPYEPVVSFAEPEREPEPLSEPTEGPPADADTTISGSGPIEATPSEVSASATSDVTKAQEADSTATEPSLFGDDLNIGTPQGDANADFFATIGTVRSALPGHVLVPHHSYAADSSVAATIGSRPSSAASDTLKTTTFKIYPNEESEVDRLLTKSLVLGDFESAVSLCLSVERYADAILLAVKGGPELLQKTQTAYFTKQTTSLPYLRLYQSIVSNDLDDIVQNADLREWQEIFVILCTFAKEDEFSGLAKQLGQRLEFQGKVVKAADPQNSQVLAKEYRRNATLCYLAAGKLEQIVHIWIEEMKEEEAITVASGDEQHGFSRYTSHALALQTFIEKVSVFRSATKYVDADLQQQDKGTEAAAGVRSYKLATLYDRYFEYADLLAAQGMLPEAVKYLAMTPAEYKGSQGGLELDFEHARQRVLRATGAAATPVAPASQATTQQTTHQRPPVTTYPGSQHPYGVQPGPYGVQPAANTYAPPAPPQQPPVKPSPYTSAYAPPNGTSAPATQPAPPVNDPYAPVGGTQTQPQQPAYRPGQPYGNTGYSGGYGGQTYGPQPGIVPPPGPQAPPPPRAPPKRTDEGWNDTPLVDAAARRTPSQKPPSLQAITSPFPNAQPTGSSPNSPYAQSSQGLPPPPRSGMSPSQMHPPQQGHMPPPPPRGGSAMAMGRPPPGQQGQPIPPPPGRAGPGGPPPFGRPASTGPGGPPANYPGRSLSPLSRAGGGYPQDRAMSPLAQGGPPARQTQSHFAGPPPSQQQPGMHPPPPGPGSAPPIRGPGPYGPPTGAQPIPVQQPQQPLPPPGPYGPPRGPAPPGPPPPGQAYAPGPGGPRGPPPMAGGQIPPPGPPQPGVQPPPGPGGSQPPPPKPAAPAPKAPKYPPGDRSHIPDNAKASYSILSDALGRLRQTTPPQQKRLVDDTERRLNLLFDALNCETLPPPLVDQLNTLTQAMAARDQQTALATHVDMLTKATGTDDIALWMSGVKQLILRA